MGNEHLEINLVRLQILKHLKTCNKGISNFYFSVKKDNGYSIDWHRCYNNLKHMEEIGLVKKIEHPTKSVWGLTDKGHTVLLKFEK